MNLVKIQNSIEKVDWVYGQIYFFRNDLYLGRSLKEYGEWAQKELNFLRKLINDESVIVDAGSFIGTHAIAFANFVGPLGRVYAFEPHPTSFWVLQQNLLLNHLENVEVYNAGLSESAGEMQVEELDLEAPNSLGSVKLKQRSADNDMVTVSIVTLDELALDACHLIKVDVEGMEGLVLAGGRSTIERCQPYIYAECNSAESAWPVILIVRKLGYQVYVYSEEAYNPKNFRKNSNNIFGNARELALICVPSHLDSAFLRRLSPTLDLIRIDNLDDLVLCLIKKPQYKREVLAYCNGTRLWGTDFWKNEGELEHFSELDKQIADLKRAVAKRDDQISRLNQDIAERDAQISGLNQDIANINSNLAQLQNTLSCMYRSHSWRITEPLRRLKKSELLVRRPLPVGGHIFNIARNIFRKLPLSYAAKEKLRFWILARSGLFSGHAPNSSLSYIQILGNEDDNLKNHSDFSEYVHFKQKLADRLAASHSAWSPCREPLLSFCDRELSKIASSISFDLPASPKVSIIIPVYGNASLTIECLASIQSASVTTSYEIIVADDASMDQTPEFLKLVNGIKVHRNVENKGFLLNCNGALHLAVGEYVVYLNNDVQVTDGWLDGLLDVFSRHRNVAAAGPKIVYPSGHLQEAGVAFKCDGSADMVGLNDNPHAPRYEYERPVDYCSGACLMVRRDILVRLGGFSEEFAPAYCEDADLCLRIIQSGYKIYYTHNSKVVHHLSRTTAAYGQQKKLQQVSINLVTFYEKWWSELEKLAAVKIVAFYLPQFHPIPENDSWWGTGFTEWTNVRKARPNFFGHYQPRVPADLGYYDLRDSEVMVAQVTLAKRYGIDAFCFYYYWFGGKRLLEMPIERMLQTGSPNFPYCLCWANENWSRRWDGRDSEILIGQQHCPEDDRAVIFDLIRHFRSDNYLRIDGRPHLLVYRVDLFPDFRATSNLWRDVCRKEGIGEIYLSMVESHDLVHKGIHPSVFGCDASVEFPPLNMAEQVRASGKLINPFFRGGIGDYRDTALRYCTRELPAYTRFRGAMPGWDNTARRQNNGFCFEHSSPEVFQAWLEHIVRQTRHQHHGDERIIFINAWNEWAEGAYLEPDTRFGHAFLEAVKKARDTERLLPTDR